VVKHRLASLVAIVLQGVLLLTVAQVAHAQAVVPPEPEPLVPTRELPTVPGVDALDPPTADNFEPRSTQFLSSLLSGQQPRRRRSTRLAKTPAVFGDFGQTGHLNYIHINQNGQRIDARSDLPLGGGNRRIKIAEHNRALPSDRIFFNYNHFQNAIERAGLNAQDQQVFENSSIDRYTFGFEKTFQDGLCSIEVRMPFTGGYDSDAFGLVASADGTGNLAVIFKRLILEHEFGVAAIGMGVDMPTGSDTSALATTGGMARLIIRNEAVHLSPFMTYLAHPHERFFCQGFAQLDFATNGNPLELTNGMTTQTGMLHDAPLLFLDLAAGVWLVREPENRFLTGLAAIFEVHYNATLAETDTVNLPAPFNSIGGKFSRFDVVNITTGLHAELGNNWRVRVGGVLPLNEITRFFDAEVNCSIVRQF
jgi:hypothetical protein